MRNIPINPHPSTSPRTKQNFNPGRTFFENFPPSNTLDQRGIARKKKNLRPKKKEPKKNGKPSGSEQEYKY